MNDQVPAQAVEEIPIIDVQKYLDKSEGWEQECKNVAYSFHKFGILKFKDPRVNQDDNDVFLNLIEKYFDDTSKKFYAGENLKDARPDLCY